MVIWGGNRTFASLTMKVRTGGEAGFSLHLLFGSSKVKHTPQLLKLAQQRPQWKRVSYPPKMHLIRFSLPRVERYQVTPKNVRVLPTFLDSFFYFRI